MNYRQLFQRHLAQTSPEPLALHIREAYGHLLTDEEDRQYIDLIGGISVANVGHRHPKVVEAIKQQADRYLHAMVYGELVQSPQVEYASALAQALPSGLDVVYFTNSGAEAVEGAIKLARRVTAKPGIVAAHNSYHGSTTGALALLGDEYWRNAFRPLLPGVRHAAYGTESFLDAIDEETGLVLLETVQAEAGVQAPPQGWLKAVAARCKAVGALLALDEIQCGFGRTGTLWAFEQEDLIPDILLLGKALGGGMPLGAFISSQEHMHHLSGNPVLGHITTFGGHPVSCAAGLAAFKALQEEELVQAVFQKEHRFKSSLKHPAIHHLASAGLLMAVRLQSFEAVQNVIQYCIKHGVFTDWFLFAPNCLRIAPPLNIPDDAIDEACRVLTSAMDLSSIRSNRNPE